jgi:hypothetical protein
MPLDILLYWSIYYPHLPFLSFTALTSRFPETYLMDTEEGKTTKRTYWVAHIPRKPDADDEKFPR